MSRVLVSLLVAAAVGPSWLSVTASDGEPPVTIIEIPISPTTTPETATTTTAPASDEPIPTTTPVEEIPADTGDTETGEPVTTVPETNEVAPVLVVGGLDWRAVAAISLILGGLAIMSLHFLLRAFRGSSILTPIPKSIASDDGATKFAEVVPPSGRFEAFEYCTGDDLENSEVHVRSLGEFSSPEEAIEAARTARAEYDPDPYPDAWWVVWSTESKHEHAWWFAEFGTEAESVIDLRSGRRVRYSGKDVLLAHSTPPEA